MSSLVINAHMGLGDHIISNGMVHYFAEEYDTIYIPHYERYGISIRSLYEGYDNIITCEYPDNDADKYGEQLTNYLVNATGSEYLAVGHPYLSYTRFLFFEDKNTLVSKRICIDFERHMYENAGLHYSFRYSHCKLPKSTKASRYLLNTLTKGEPYRLIQSAGSKREYPLDLSFSDNNLLTIKIEKGHTDNVFDFYDLIINAKEIHVIGSFMHPYVDSLFSVTSADLYYHSIVCEHVSTINSTLNKYCWNIIDYRYKL
jgi:hypothetical protein